MRRLQYYYRVYRDTVRMQGRREALRRSWLFVATRLKARLARRNNTTFSAEAAMAPAAVENMRIVGTLPVAPVSRSLVLIVSDIRIKQCVHYRIHQKMRGLAGVGIRCQHVQPVEYGRLMSLLPFCHTVIVYRTALDADRIAQFREGGARVVFECDDLIIGAEVVRKSGILREIPEHTGKNLCELADLLMETATLCDELIVSTDYLKRIYAKPGSGLQDKPIHVVPNFLETACTAPVTAARHTFAYTTPSGSIRTELQMLTAFLRSHDAVCNHPWSILIMGNVMAAQELRQAGFRHGRIEVAPFSEYETYIEQLGQAGCVLIPLARTAFNSAKTPIRVMDAALAGTQAVFSPVGDYGKIHETLPRRMLAVEDEDWGGAGGYADTTLEIRNQNVAELQQAINLLFGPAAAETTYRQVFADGFGIRPSEALAAE